MLISRSAAILTGDLDSVLKRAGEAIRQLAETMLGVDPEHSHLLVDGFRDAALDWVRGALGRYRAFAENHDRLPMGLSFDDVRLILDAADGSLSVEVGGVHFRREFDFRTTGVVFDIRGSSAVRQPAPGFFVDTGETGAATANSIVKKVRTDLPAFGIAEDIQGVCVLIRGDDTDYRADQVSAWTVDFDVFVPFDPEWKGGNRPTRS